MENDEENLKVGGGIMAVAIIRIVFASFMIIGYLCVLGVKDKLKTYMENLGQSTAALNTTSCIIIIAISILIIIGLALLLKRKLAGVILYFVCEAAKIIYTIVIGGLNVVSLIISLILPVIMIILVCNRKGIFGIGNNQAANM